MEPCGSLPVTTVRVALHWCHHHQAWSAHVELLRQDDEEAVLCSTASLGFGPFDRMRDVAEWLQVSLTALEAPPGIPWW